MDNMYEDMLKEASEDPLAGVSEPSQERGYPEDLPVFPTEHAKPHKTLPHLAGRRAYEPSLGAEEVKNTVEKARPDGVEEEKKGISKAGEKKPRSEGLQLDHVPRITVSNEENSLLGIQYTSKLQHGSPVPVPSSIARHTSTDDKNSIPRFFRPTLRILPNEGAGFFAATGLPFGASVQPFADLSEQETPVPLCKSILRCHRCGGYVNPEFTFSDLGDKFSCNLCETSGMMDFPYFEKEGPDEKPELKMGTYEFIASPGLAGKPITEHNIVLVIECTANSINNGLAQQVAASIKTVLDYIPYPDKTNIGIITYGNTVQFYTIGSEPSVVIMGDIMAPFCPIHKSRLLFNVATEKAKIEAIIEKALLLHDSSVKAKAIFGSSGSSAGPAIKAAVDAIKASSGKIMWFCMDMPSLGYGGLTSRNNSNLYNTEKEKSIYTPTEKYTEIAGICAKEKVCIDIFACGHGEMDLASVVPLANWTGGEICYYPAFSSPNLGEKLHFDVFRNLTRYTVYDVAMRARCSLGLRVTKYLGAFGETTNPTVFLPSMNSDQTVGFLLEQESKLKAPAYIQFALLFTTSTGERKIRVFNYTFSVTDQLSTFIKFTLIDHAFLSVDMDALISLETKKGINEIMKNGNRSAREQLCQTAINTLAYYRKKVSSSSGSSQFILPETMKIYPLLVLGLMKTSAFRYLDEVKVDAKVASMSILASCSFTHLLMNIYPKVYSVSQILKNPWGTLILDEEGKESTVVYKPTNIPASVERMVNTDAYIIANSDFVYVYVPKAVPSEVLSEAFGKSSFEEFKQDGSENDGSELIPNTKIRNIIECLRGEKGGAYQQIKVVPAGHPLERHIITDLLVEDCKNPKRDFSYLQFLTHVHRLVLGKFNTL